jgi:hypothetical protein
LAALSPFCSGADAVVEGDLFGRRSGGLSALLQAPLAGDKRRPSLPQLPMRRGLLADIAPPVQMRGCYRQFSVTSGTIFASRKLSFVDFLGAICLFVNASKGLSAVQLSRDLDVQYKTAFVLTHKLREAMAAETADMTHQRC